MRLKCVCGNPLKYVKDDSGCGDLRCLSCGKTSGYCANTHDAIMAFKRIYNHYPFEEVKGMNELTREQKQELIELLKIEQKKLPKSRLHLGGYHSGKFNGLQVAIETIELYPEKE